MTNDNIHPTIRIRKQLRDKDPEGTLPIRCALRALHRGASSPALAAKLKEWIKQDTERLAHRSGASLAPSAGSRGRSPDLTETAYPLLQRTGEGGQ